jgi:hypothetical protein
VINIIATIRADLALGQLLASWTGVVIVLDIVDEVSAREEATVWVVRGLRLWDDGEELCGKVGDGVNQAADLISATASIPSLNIIPLTTFGNWF